MPIGFSVSFKIDTKNYNKKLLKANLLSLKKVIVAFAGPFVNLLFIIFFLVIRKDTILSIDKEMLIYTNILLFIFNMLPIYPLDGGRILKNLFYIFLGKIMSLKLTNIISNIVTIILSVAILVISIMYNNFIYIFVLIYIWIMRIKENKIYKIKIKIYKILKNNLAIKQD